MLWGGDGGGGGEPLRLWRREPWLAVRRGWSGTTMRIRGRGVLCAGPCVDVVGASLFSVVEGTVRMDVVTPLRSIDTCGWFTDWMAWIAILIEGNG